MCSYLYYSTCFIFFFTYLYLFYFLIALQICIGAKRTWDTLLYVQMLYSFVLWVSVQNTVYIYYVLFYSYTESVQNFLFPWSHTLVYAVHNNCIIVYNTTMYAFYMVATRTIEIISPRLQYHPYTYIYYTQWRWD